MEISVNGETTHIPEGTTLQELMDQLQIHGGRGIAIAVNEAVIPSSQWQTTYLSQNDKVLVIRATQGG